MFKCKDVHQLVASGQDEDLGWMGRMNLKMHLLMCRHCRNYVAQVRAIGETVRDLWQDRAQDAEAIERLEREVLAAIPSGGTGKDPG